MTAVEKIQVAEERVEQLQGGLETVQAVLVKAEEVAVSGREAKRRLRKTFLTLLAVGVFIAIVAAMAKKMAASEVQPPQPTWEPAPEPLDDEAITDVEEEDDEGEGEDGSAAADEPAV